MSRQPTLSIKIKNWHGTQIILEHFLVLFAGFKLEKTFILLTVNIKTNSLEKRKEISCLVYFG